MRDDPPDQPYPEGLFPKFTFYFELDQGTGNYMLFCPEWQCEIACGSTPGDSARLLASEIASHNREEVEHAQA
jgi:hypothetical protein